MATAPQTPCLSVMQCIHKIYKVGILRWWGYGDSGDTGTEYAVLEACNHGIFVGGGPISTFLVSKDPIFHRRFVIRRDFGIRPSRTEICVAVIPCRG